LEEYLHHIRQGGQEFIYIEKGVDLVKITDVMDFFYSLHNLVFETLHHLANETCWLQAYAMHVGGDNKGIRFSE
jgi:hypothetical protein